MAPTAFQLRQASAGSVLSEDTRDDHLHLSDIASVGTEEGDTPDVSTVKQRLSLFQRLRQRWLLGRAAGKMVNPEASRLVPRSGSSKSRRSRRQSTINVPSALLLRALIARLEKRGVDVDGEAAEELSLLLRWHVRHGLQESSLWLVDAFDQLSTGGGQTTASQRPILPSFAHTHTHTHTHTHHAHARCVRTRGCATRTRALRTATTQEGSSPSQAGSRLPIGLRGSCLRRGGTGRGRRWPAVNSVSSRLRLCIGGTGRGRRWRTGSSTGSAR